MIILRYAKKVGSFSCEVLILTYDFAENTESTYSDLVDCLTFKLFHDSSQHLVK